MNCKVQTLGAQCVPDDGSQSQVAKVVSYSLLYRPDFYIYYNYWRLRVRVVPNAETEGHPKMYTRR